MLINKRNDITQGWDTSAGTGKLCILGHLGLVFIWSCFLSCLLFLLFYVSLRNLCSGTCRKIPRMAVLQSLISLWKRKGKKVIETRGIRIWSPTQVLISPNRA